MIRQKRYTRPHNSVQLLTELLAANLHVSDVASFKDTPTAARPESYTADDVVLTWDDAVDTEAAVDAVLAAHDPARPIPRTLRQRLAAKGQLAAHQRIGDP